MWARICWVVGFLFVFCSMTYIYAELPNLPVTTVDLRAQDVIPLTDWLLEQEPVQANPPNLSGKLQPPVPQTTPQLLKSTASDPILRLERVFRVPLGSTVRASCQIIVSEPTDAILMYGISGQAMLRLNGEILLTHNSQPASVAVSFTRESQNSQFIQVKLPAGKSLLTLEFPAGSNGEAPGFSLRLATLQAAQQYLSRTEPYTGTEIFLNRRTYPKDSKLQLSSELQVALRCLTIASTVQIIDLDGNVMYRGPIPPSGDWAISADRLPAGVYNATLESPLFVLHQQLFIGDPTAYFESINRKAHPLASTLTDERLRFDLAALEFRFGHLNEPAHYLPDDNDWQRKIVFTLYEYQQMVSTCSKNPGDERRRPGLHYRSYRSAIDGQIQYYMLYYPNTGSKLQKLPLVIIVPYETAPLRPFLESVHVAKIAYLRTIARSADKYGYAVLIPDTRGNVGISPIEEADLLESLADVKRDVPIDPKSIYLMGFSFGATRALMLGIHHPGMFAAIAGVGSTLSITHRETSNADRDQLNAAKPWLKLNNLRNIASLTNTPLYFMHGDKDSELPIEVFQNFVEYCRHEGVETTLDVIPNMNHVNYPVSPFPKVFDFFKNKTVPESPQKVIFETGDLNYATSYWVRIEHPITRLATSRISASYDDMCQVRIQGNNVADFDLRLADLNCKSTKVSVTVGDQQPIVVSRRQAPAAFHFDAATSRWRLTSNSGSSSVGPLYHVFERSFKVIVPQPTAGSSGEAAVRSAAAFCQGWTQLFFVPCPTESPFTMSALSGVNNLVVVGPTSDIPFVQEILKQAGVVTGKEFVQIAGKRFEGSDLSYLLLAHGVPGEPRRILIVGGTNSTSCYFMPATLVRTGWYDVAVWNCADTQNPQLLDIAYYDNDFLKWVSDVP